VGSLVQQTQLIALVHIILGGVRVVDAVRVLDLRGTLLTLDLFLSLLRRFLFLLPLVLFDTLLGLMHLEEAPLLFVQDLKLGVSLFILKLVLIFLCM